MIASATTTTTRGRAGEQQGRRSNMEVREGKRKQKGETRSGHYLYPFMYEAGLRTGLDRKRFR